MLSLTPQAVVNIECSFILQIALQKYVYQIIVGTWSLKVWESLADQDLYPGYVKPKVGSYVLYGHAVNTIPLNL